MNFDLRYGELTVLCYGQWHGKFIFEFSGLVSSVLWQCYKCEIPHPQNSL